MSILTFSNGSKADIKVLPFEQAMNLKNIFLKSISDSNLSPNEPLVKLYAHIDSLPEFNKVVMNCLERCLYDGKKITIDTFEPIEARENYYEIVLELLKVNITPFFKGLASRLQALSEEMAKIQR